ncbi:MAG: hypothetical protein JWM80_6474 [Cyanobacteria bacterium RYN_339]|nr:hypothetical protein [Cyanobacteria bacterium RYN_339]
MRNSLALVLAAALLTGGCFAQQPAKGSSKVVETSSRKPDWADKRFMEKDGKLYFVGTVAAVRDLALGEEQAEYQAKKVVASSIQETFQREFSTATSGSNSLAAGSPLGQAIESALSASTDRIKIRGMMPMERYWERVETVTDDGVASSYNVMLLVVVPKAEYDRAKSQVVDETARIEQVQADAKAREALERVRKRLETP